MGFSIAYFLKSYGPKSKGKFLSESRSEKKPLSKVFGLAIFAAIAGYFIDLFGCMFMVEFISSNLHDKSIEASMTGAFVFGPLIALVAAIGTIVYCLRQRKPLSYLEGARLSWNPIHHYIWHRCLDAMLQII